MTIFLWIGVSLSAAALVGLAIRDPKRLRNVQRSGRMSRPAWGLSQRRLLATIALMPGLALLLAAQWAAFLLWAGGCMALGWALAHWLAPAPKAESRSSCAENQRPA